MQRRFFIAVFIFFSLPLWAGTITPLNQHVSTDLLSKQKGQLFKANPSWFLSKTLLNAANSPSSFIRTLEPSEGIDRVNGGSYWLYAKLSNVTSNQRQWVFEPYDSVIDTIHTFIYTSQGVQQATTGYLHPQIYNLSYAIDFDVAPGTEVEILVYIQSRYFPGYPRMEVKSKPSFLYGHNIESSLVIACFGAVVVMMIYNFFIAVWARDRSYTYYSFYLLTSLVAWMAAFNVFAAWGWSSYWLLLPPFFLTMTFNVLYCIYFLDLPNSNPKLVRLSWVLVVWASLMSFALPLMSSGQYMLIHGLSSVVWMVGGLYCGISRLYAGYKPARFFVAGFAVIFIGGFASISPVLGSSYAIKHHYLITLIAQTVDILLLSLALADRINILRHQKELAFVNAFRLEKIANEKEQAANLKLQEALQISEYESQRKTDFLRMVSHELRTPLHSIMSSAEQWEQSEDEETRWDLVSYIRYGAARLRSQIDNLVVLAETDDENLTLSTHDFEVRPMLDRLCICARSLLHDDVDFKLVMDDNLPSVVKGDGYLLEHMLRTVVENACQYTRKGEVVFRLKWDGRANVLDIKLVDTGCGMTRDQEKAMFNGFVQVSRGLDHESGGLGLGLKICYRLCNMLFADFVLHSKVAEGTEISIQVPIEAIPGRPTVGVTKASREARVLIIEDNVINAQVLERIVEHLGYEADIEYSGQAALSRLEQEIYQVILMDIQMPVMDGITAARWIRSRHIATPIVAVTANSDTKVRRRCIDVGMNDLLVKPVRRADIRRVLEQQSRRASNT